jgi:hypothetical protein
MTVSYGVERREVKLARSLVGEEALSLRELARVERGLGAVFRYAKGATSNLRTAVRSLALQLRAQDASADCVERLLRYVAEHEAEGYAIRTRSIVTGKLGLEGVIGSMIVWINDS